jgi:ATP-dependent DNA helicase RecQ
MQERFSNMLNYARCDTECRSVTLQRYFGDTEATPCGVCDVCLARKRQQKDDASLCQEILSLLGEESLSTRELCHKMKHNPERVATIIDKMLTGGKISATISGKLIIIE